ncbi:MAG: GlsB/YeaQ/YmgE family stress response membrane protein [Roseiflexaceae bacterium]
MGFFASIVIGVIAGWLTGKLMQGGGDGFWADLGLGLVGALVGGWLSSILLGVDLTSGFNLTTLVVSVIGAVVVVLIFRLVTRRSLT